MFNQNKNKTFRVFTLVSSISTKKVKLGKIVSVEEFEKDLKQIKEKIEFGKDFVHDDSYVIFKKVFNKIIKLMISKKKYLICEIEPEVTYNINNIYEFYKKREL